MMDLAIQKARKAAKRHGRTAYVLATYLGPRIAWDASQGRPPGPRRRPAGRHRDAGRVPARRRSSRR